MSDPLNTLISNETTMKFAKVHSPKMKSVYWKHFGFPTNENDHIITKQSVVCVLCHKVLTNHGNTTNLRAHLQHRHKDVFYRICRENNIQIPARRLPPKPVKQALPKLCLAVPKIKLEYENPSPTNDDSNNQDDHSMLYETVVPMTYDDDAESFTKNEIAFSVSNSQKATSSVNIEAFPLMDENSGQQDGKNSNFRLDVIEMDPYQMQDVLVNLIVKDLRNVSTLYDEGMSQFLRAFSGSSQIPSKKKITAIIQELHSDKLTTLADQIKVHSQMKTYSLGFELWMNVEGKYFLSMFYNYTTDIPEFNLHNQMYRTIEYNKFTSIDVIFEEFNLENCSAAVVNYDDEDYLKEFLKVKNIPVILSYSVIIDKCLQGVFAIDSVNSVIEEVKEVVTRYASEICSKDIEIPITNSEFPWTFYELLKFFSESVSWPEDIDALVCSAKIIADTIAPLAITLDTLKGEDIPHSSMVTPITTKILNKKINITETDDAYVNSIKSTLTELLRKFVVADDHLTISAMMDPRFHRLIDVDDISRYADIISEIHSKTIKYSGISTKKEKKDKSSTTPANKKSNLEIFFDIQDTTTSMSITNDGTVEADLERYRNEVYVSLDESPSLWWAKVGAVYASLKQVALTYQCVPCVVNMNFKKSLKQQISEHLKRFMLTGNLIDAILFLHYHLK